MSVDVERGLDGSGYPRRLVRARLVEKAVERPEPLVTSVAVLPLARLSCIRTVHRPARPPGHDPYRLRTVAVAQQLTVHVQRQFRMALSIRHGAPSP